MTTPLPQAMILGGAYGVGYHEQQIQAYGKAEYERALLDAMNATRAFGRTGEVMAMVIAALKEKNV